MSKDIGSLPWVIDRHHVSLGPSSCFTGDVKQTRFVPMK